MACYALNSIENIIQQNQYYLLCLSDRADVECQITALQITLFAVRDVLKNVSSISQNMEIRIKGVAQKAEDLIDQLLITDPIFSNHEDKAELTIVHQQFDSIKEELLRVDKSQTSSDPAVLLSLQPVNHFEHKYGDPVYPDFNSSRTQPWWKDCVGIDINMDQPELQIIPIVGMGGVGKTTLAKKIYNHPSIRSHFDVHSWVTLSREYHVGTTLLPLLDSLANLTDKVHVKSGDHETVHNILKGRRYLIVLDNVCDTEAWEKMRSFFPDNRNGSRILITTRTPSVALCLYPFVNAHNMCPMDDEESWKLLSLKVFGEVDCPTELVTAGRNIARNCGGLPLSIVMISGLLSTSVKTQEFWKFVERNMSVSTTDTDLQSLEILSMCYTFLPYHLKQCFLYVGAFPEHYGIRASKIIKLWIAEGFIKPTGSHNLEDASELYLNALISRNLLLVSKKKHNGKVKEFKIHDVLRDFCRNEAVKEKFMGFDVKENTRRLSVHPLYRPTSLSREFSSKPSERQSIFVTRSFLCIGHTSQENPSVFWGLKFLKVFDGYDLEFFQFPMEFLELRLLKSLSFCCHSDLPSVISRLRYLQNLTIRRLPVYRAFSLPPEMWEMAHLRHIKSKQTCIWYYPRNGKGVALETLQTLSDIQTFGLTSKFFENTPNLRKLGVFCNATMRSEIDLACLEQLETLKCSSNLSRATDDFLFHILFPPSIKKLTLAFCRIRKELMSIFGKLPCLEELKLQKSELTEIMWDPFKGEFRRLRCLVMEELNLVDWRAGKTHFPLLQSLVIRGCRSMTEVPKDIGSIPTLELIEVEKCSPAVGDSAMQLFEDYMCSGSGNNILRVIVDGVDCWKPSWHHDVKDSSPNLVKDLTPCGDPVKYHVRENLHVKSWETKSYHTRDFGMFKPSFLNESPESFDDDISFRSSITTVSSKRPNVDLQLSLSSGGAVSGVTTLYPGSSVMKGLMYGLNTDEKSTGTSFFPFTDAPNMENSRSCSSSIITTPVSCISVCSSSKQCQFQGCIKEARGASGLCIAHGRGQRCQRNGCYKGAEGQTVFCKAHGGGRSCEFLGCTKSAEGRTDFCIAHGGGKRCSHEECSRAARGKSGLCIRHGGGKRCQMDNCTKSAEGLSGLCISHGGSGMCTTKLSL